MFDLRGDNMIAALLVRLRDSANGEVIGFGPACDKDNFRWRGVDQGCDFAARSLDRSFRSLAERMRRLRVAHLFGEVRQHRFDSFWSHPSRRAVVEINFHSSGQWSVVSGQW